ncbi:MAG: Na/Pi cotransporter family protein [gamma proteobacterium symbiont of Taylorina sp.]|nr:Na/Pi cotransporter family protein [gamma proteobacterium symbiont of Taylorina sp.]
MMNSQLFRSGLGLCLMFITFMVFASDVDIASKVESPDWLQVNLGLFGGLALFLAGLQLLSEGMKKAAGQAMTTVLAKLTTNRFMGAVTGAFVTGILNSSTVTTLLVVGFISGGMMTLAQSVGVIMGANIGSTVTAQLLAFNLSAYSLGPVAIGFFMLFTAKRDKTKYYGMMIMGIGLVFYGMGLMSEAMVPLRSYEPFIEILKELEHPLAGILAGAVFTAIVQSSAATVGIAIAMASEGLLGLSAGIALALGANIGTAVTTAIMGVLSSKSVDAVRASVVHVSFNVIGVLIWLPFIGLLVDTAVWLSPSSPELEGMARAASEVPRQIANANTFFNIINTVLFIGFTTWFARMAEWLIADKAPPKGIIIEPKYLDENLLITPNIALQQVRLELARLGNISMEMLRDIAPAFQERDLPSVREIAKRYNEVEILEAEILRYLTLLRQNTLSEEDSREFQAIMMAVDNFESLTGIIESNLVSLAEKVVALDSKTSEKTRAMMVEVYSSVLKSVEQTVQAIKEKDELAAESVLMLKEPIRQQSELILSRKADRLANNESDYLALIRLEMSFVENMRHIYSLSRRIAKVVLPSVLAQRE